MSSSFWLLLLRSSDNVILTDTAESLKMRSTMVC